MQLLVKNLEPENFADLKEQFEKLDIDQSGLLNVHELKEAFK
jgi:Ca2+-binding EF-hand superfamily protein